jgi:4-hydroxyphenylpyruvate dioxygenase
VLRSVATVCLSGTLEDKLEAAARAGFDGVELFEPDLLASPLSPSEVRARAEGLGLTIDLYQPLRDLEGVGPDAFAANLRRAEQKLSAMEDLGAPALLVCSNVAAGAIDDDALAAAQLRALAERAGRRGLRVAYEALAWGRHVSEYDHAWRIVEAADHPALGICLDSFHVLSRGTPLDAIAAIPGEKLFFLQLADAPHLVMDVLQWSRHYRCFPGQGGFDLPAFTARVLDAGYDGPLSLEVFNDHFRQADPERMAVDAMRSLLILEEALAPAPDAADEGAAGLDRDRSARNGQARPAPRRRPARPAPAAAPLAGYAFVEIAVEPGSAATTQRALHALGFAHTAQHRTKPVALWQHGEIRVLLNAGAPDAPGVAALAVESADPDRSARRAEALLAPVLSRDRGPDEADLSAIAAPDGTSIFFCRTDAGGAASWLRDFEPLAAGDDAGEGAALLGIDHVALSQPFHFFDEAVLFYRSVLGLRPRESHELAGPDGLVRSRAVTNADGSVRLALNVPLLAPGGEGHPAGLQHVAFATGDALAVARAMRARGTPPLRIPGNYYDDLAARTDLEPETVDALRDAGLLHDRDAHGDLLHCYTPLLGGRLFLEVVERRGGYDGYGAANSPVRMAAQREPASVL